MTLSTSDLDDKEPVFTKFCLKSVNIPNHGVICSANGCIAFGFPSFLCHLEWVEANKNFSMILLSKKMAAVRQIWNNCLCHQGTSPSFQLREQHPDQRLRNQSNKIVVTVFTVLSRWKPSKVRSFGRFSRFSRFCHGKRFYLLWTSLASNWRQ